MAIISHCALKTWCFVFCIVWCRFCEAQRVPAVFVLGDSYGDPGNNNCIRTLMKSNFPPYGKDFSGQKPTGRFSDGKIMPDYVVSGLGIKDLLPAYLDPSVRDQDLVTGVSFASAGSGLDNLTASTLSVFPVWKQIQYFKEYRTRLTGLAGRQNATNILKKGVMLISIGTNDFIANYYLRPVRPKEYTVSQFQDFLVQSYSSYIEELYGLDVRRIGIINVPPLGCLPVQESLRFLQSKGGCVKEVNEAAAGFNAKVVLMIEMLKSKLPGLKIASLDYYGLVFDAIKYPKKYGFEVTARACCGTGSIEFGYLCNPITPFTCNDASKYVFFDSIHLTQKSYAIISNAFLNGGIQQIL